MTLLVKAGLAAQRSRKRKVCLTNPEHWVVAWITGATRRGGGGGAQQGAHDEGAHATLQACMHVCTHSVIVAERLESFFACQPFECTCNSCACKSGL